MRTIDKPIRRELARVTSRGRTVVMTILPGDLVQFREKGRRQYFETSLEACFHLAAKQAADRELRERGARRKERRKE